MFRPQATVDFNARGELQVFGGSTGVAEARPQFTLFRRLPGHIQRMIWQQAMDERGDHYVVLKKGLCVRQPLPALAHVSEMARNVAFENGGIFFLGDGSCTWFNPEKDYLYWENNDIGLGQLGPSVQKLILTPIERFEDLHVVFHELRGSNKPSQLKAIFVAGETIVVDDYTYQWNQLIMSQLFESNKILAPALSQFDSLIDRIDDAIFAFPHDVMRVWGEWVMVPWDENPEAWSRIAGDILLAWIRVAAMYSEEVGFRPFLDLELDIIQHPSGVSMWDYFESILPDLYPTIMFLKCDGKELIGYAGDA
ncbi:hypothetical protein F5Y11DRAFT_328703 [Daldinia sp. FL1419]|nr:hypothetical protein F5Y11DRAFT_328703 [Daldinia sp. FL1419]